MLGLSIYGFSLTLMGSSQNFMQLIIFRVLQGVGLGVFGPSSLGLVAQLKGRGEEFRPLSNIEQSGFDVGAGYRRDHRAREPLLPFLHWGSTIILSNTISFPFI